MGKHRGLSKLKYYCQPCQKQCHDEHGFQLHSASLSHITKTKASSAHGKQEYSRRFEQDFTAFFRGRSGPVALNKVYNEFVKDPAHVHMHATRWPSLTSFAHHLQRTGALTIVSVQPELVVQRIDASEQARVQRLETEKEHKLRVREAAQEAVAALVQSSRDSEPQPRPHSEPLVAAANGDSSESGASRAVAPVETAANVRPPRIAFALKKKQR